MDIAWAMPDTAMVLDMDTAMDSDTTARGLLTLSPRPRLMPLLTLTTMEDTVWAMPDTAMDTVWEDTTAMDMVMDIAWAMLDTAMDMDTTARGLLMPSPRPRLMLLPTLTTMVDMVMAIAWAMPDMVMVIMAMDMVMAVDTVMVMAMATTDKSSEPYLLHAQHQKGELAIHQDLSVNHQLLCQHQMDYFSLSFIPHLCCQFQCCQPSPARNGKQEAIE